MRRKLLSGLLVVCLGIIGTCFVTITHHHQTVHSAKEIKTEMERKHENIKLAKTYARIDRGWTGKEWRCLYKLWLKESRFDSEADNPRSSAHGVAQLLGEKSRVPTEQILRGFRYISHRYNDSPCRAYDHSRRHGWY